MKDILAEELLVKVMKWSPAQIKVERPVLQALARYMYDEYQQFSPGMRFISSLALWLNQFAPADRELAYAFMRTHLLFIGQSELKHLISTTFPDHVQPLLIEQATHEADLPRWAVTKAIKSIQYRCLLRQSLFLGLSDGAHIDLFRRSNPLLSNEQIWSTYEVTDTKREDLVSNLIQGLNELTGSPPEKGNALFKTIFLLDDFRQVVEATLWKKRENIRGKFRRCFQRCLLKKEICVMPSISRPVRCMCFYM